MEMGIKSSDMMCIAMARKLKDAENVFHGVASTVPMIAIMLAKKLYNPHLNYLNITGGVNVEDVDLQISSDGANLYDSSRSSFSLTDIFDLSARGKLDVAFLSGGQVDRFGSINNSLIGTKDQMKVKLPGGAGSAVLVPTCKRAFIWKSKHEKRGFVDKVDFVTTRGNVNYVFTPLCIFQCRNGLLYLDTIYPNSSLEEIRENTGFQIVYNELHVMEEPSIEELNALNEIDPRRLRECEF